MSYIEDCITAIVRKALESKPWARSAQLGRILQDVGSDDIVFIIHDGVVGRGMRTGRGTVPGRLFAEAREGGWYEEDVRAMAHAIESALGVALTSAGFSPFKRTTRWRIDRNGRRQWQVGQALK